MTANAIMRMRGNFMIEGELNRRIAIVAATRDEGESWIRFRERKHNCGEVPPGRGEMKRPRESLNSPGSATQTRRSLNVATAENETIGPTENRPRHETSLKIARSDACGVTWRV